MNGTDSEIIKILPARMRKELLSQEEIWSNAQEIRVRAGKYLHIITAGEDREMHLKDSDSRINDEDMREMTEYIFGYSMYAHEEELRHGYLTLKGGHRVGITGEAVMEQGMVKRLKNISSFNIRISRQIKGAADHIMKYAGKNLLLISPPRMGKTTLLRDILRQLADTPGENVGIVDERSEIAACYRGRPSNDCGERVDVLDGCPKAEGMLMLLRSMSPTVIGVDELGQYEDVEAVLRIVGSGVRIIATVHGDNMQQIQNKRVFAALFENQVFHYSLLIGKHEIKVYDGDGNVLEVIAC
jgi:stage III sporulation protein AA